MSAELLTSVLGRGEADLEISTFRRTIPTAHWRRLVIEPPRLVVRSEHPLARRSRIRLTEVSSEPFIMLRPTSLLRQLCEDLCEEAGFTPTLAFEGDDLSTLRGFVAAGLGVAIVPALREGSPDAVPGSMSCLEISDPLAVRGMGLTWSTERRLLPAAELFRQHTIDRAAARLLPDIAKGG